MPAAEIALRDAMVADCVRAIHEMVLNGGLRAGAPGEVRALARAHLFVALARLEDAGAEAGRGKGLLLQFLYEAGLIGGWEGVEGSVREPLIALNGANLRGVSLPHANLAAASFIAAILDNAELNGASLAGAHLAGVDLMDADLSDADLTGASLQLAVLDGTTFDGANLTSARVTARQLECCLLTDRTILPEHLLAPPTR